MKSNMKEVGQCILCNGPFDHVYVPMQSWNIKGKLCSKCYSKKISEHYPGTHERVNKSN
jgi:hypothetical protein